MGSKIERCILNIAWKVTRRRVGGGRKFKKGIHVLGGGGIYWKGREGLKKNPRLRENLRQNFIKGVEHASLETGMRRGRI